MLSTHTIYAYKISSERLRNIPSITYSHNIYKKNKRMDWIVNDIQLIFFLKNNVRILLIIERMPNRVHWECTMGAQIRKQKNNSQEKKKMKNKKNEKKPHSIQRECVRKKT